MTEKSLQEELAEVRAKRAALEASKNARDAEAEVRATLEREKRALADAEAIEKAERDLGKAFEYGSEPANGAKAAIVRTDLGVVIVKRANHVLFKRFQDSEEASTKEFDRLVRPCLVHPDGATFDRYIEEQPAILSRVAGAVATLAGLRAKEQAGKS